MTKRRILTLNPSRAKAAYYRACAMAALRADSSLSVRLRRYNEAIDVYKRQGAIRSAP